MSSRAFALRTIKSCPLCGSRSILELGEAFDDCCGYPGRFPVGECRFCGLGLMLRQVAPQFLGRLYERYYHQVLTDGRSKRNSCSKLKAFAFFARAYVLRGAELWRWARAGGSILDVGAGEG